MNSADVVREIERRKPQKQRVLELLKRRGEAGATNDELNEIGFRYGARIYELRREGYAIGKQHLRGGRFRFWLQPEDQQEAG